jgi:RimJ/RimL family protein N-acetyltransferase
MEISIQPFTESDIPLLIDQIPDEKFLVQWAGPAFKWPLNRPQLEIYIRESGNDPRPSLIYKAVNSEGKTVGHGELSKIDELHQSARLSRILVYKEYRGLGYGKQIVDSLLSVGFVDRQLHRISLHVFEFNKRAIRCYESVGFRNEGIFRECRRLGEKYLDLRIMSMLKREWRLPGDRLLE